MKTIKRTLTLSIYEKGLHRVTGPVPKKTILKSGNLSFAESLTPFLDMREELSNVPLGSKVEISMRVLKSKKKETAWKI